MHNAERYIRAKIEDVRTYGNPIGDILSKIDLAYFHGYIDLDTLSQLTKNARQAKTEYDINREIRHREFMEEQKRKIDEYRHRHN